MDEFERLPDVWYGEVSNKPPKINWRMRRDFLYEIDTDGELRATPPDVVAILGFDPKELED